MYASDNNQKRKKDANATMQDDEGEKGYLFAYCMWRRRKGEGPKRKQFTPRTQMRSRISRYFYIYF